MQQHNPLNQDQQDRRFHLAMMPVPYFIDLFNNLKVWKKPDLICFFYLNGSLS